MINPTKMEILQPTLQRSKPEMDSEMFILKKNPRWFHWTSWLGTTGSKILFMFYIYSGCYRSKLCLFYIFSSGGERLRINLTKYAWFLKWYLQPCFLRLKALIIWPSLHSFYPPEKFSETKNSQKLIIAILGGIQHCKHPNFWSLADFSFLVFSFPFLKGFANISAFLLKLVRSHPMTKRSYLRTCSSCLLFTMTRKMRQGAEWHTQHPEPTVLRSGKRRDLGMSAQRLRGCFSLVGAWFMLKSINALPQSCYEKNSFKVPGIPLT